METIYIVCATVGGTIMICQFVMTLLGAGGDSDADASHDFDAGHVGAGDAADADIPSHTDGMHHHGSSWFLGVLSFRTVIAAFTFFGLAALATPESAGSGIRLGVGLAAGLGAMFLVAYIMQALYRLNADGTVRIERTIGSAGKVYLTVPGQKSGLGKVTLNVQGRTVEYNAVTARDALPTGANIVVLNVVSADTVEVAQAEAVVPA